MAHMTKPYFHVLHCKPQKDWHAVNNARECGWQAKLFWFKEPSRQMVRERGQLRPVAPRVRNWLPGYVFVTGGSDYFKLANPLYVNRVLCDGDRKPIKLYEDNPNMVTLLSRADEKGFVESATAPLFDYDEGSTIEIFTGPFQGFEARVIEMGKKQVQVELGVFGKVKVPHSQVRRKAVVA